MAHLDIKGKDFKVLACNNDIKKAVTPSNPALRMPCYYGHFPLSLGKALTFSLNSLNTRTPINADNGHLFLAQLIDAHEISTNNRRQTVETFYSNRLTSGNKRIHTPPLSPPFKVGVFVVFYIAQHCMQGMGGGKAIFPPFEVSKGQKKPSLGRSGSTHFVADCLNHCFSISTG